MTDPVGRKRGRYQTRVGGPHDAPSVTMVLGVINKPGLAWGSANETAMFAIHRQDAWIDLPPAEAYDRLRKHHRGVWNDKASRGTAVHALAEAWARGREVDCPPECTGFLDALERFYFDWSPRWVELERTVVHDAGGESYGGTFDAIGDLADGDRWLLDVKTGASVYDDVALQLAGYRFAGHLGTYDDTGELTGTEPNLEVGRCGVIHLREDGTYDLVPVRAERGEFEAFLAARRLWTFTQQKPLGTPMAPPVRELEMAG